jgi:hypothetical protein
MGTNVISLGHQDALGNRVNAFIRSFRPPPPHGKITLGNELDHLGFSSGCSVFDSALSGVCNVMMCGVFLKKTPLCTMLAMLRSKSKML